MIKRLLLFMFLAVSTAAFITSCDDDEETSGPVCMDCIVSTATSLAGVTDTIAGASMEFCDGALEAVMASAGVVEEPTTGGSVETIVTCQ